MPCTAEVGYILKIVIKNLNNILDNFVYKQLLDKIENFLTLF